MHSRISTFVVCALLGTFGSSMGASSDAVQLLMNKARALEGRGRLDLAAESWDRLLLSEPNNTEALAALARLAKQSGKTEAARGYLERLRKLDPHHPAISQVASTREVASHRTRLQAAESLAAQQQYEEAMEIFREIFGEDPPSGAYAVAYYETLAATRGGYDNAVAGLERLSRAYPDSPEYKLSLGRVLTHKAEHRAAGMRLLESLSGDGFFGLKARQSWRQALVWEGVNPTAIAPLRSYLSRFPDAELQKNLALAMQAEANAGAVQSHGEKLGYEALKAGDLKEAEAQFQAALAATPDAPGPLAGAGYVRMKRQDFKAALELMERAAAGAPNSKSIAEGVATARFWNIMQQATAALKDGAADSAESLYRQALAIQPEEGEALLGLSGVLMQQGSEAKAIPHLEHLVKLKPQDQNAWRMLVMAKLHQSGGSAALASAAQIPAETSDVLRNDVDYLLTLSTAYTQAGRQEEAEKAIRSAFSIVSASGEYPAKTRIAIAGMLLRHEQAAQAANLYQSVADQYPETIEAWTGLVDALLHDQKHGQAMAALQRMPKELYDQAVHDAAFLRSVAAAHEMGEHYELAESFLQQAIELETSAGKTPDPATQARIAQIWLRRGYREKAEKMLRQLAATRPQDREVWRGLITVLHESNRDEEAIAQYDRIPAVVSAQLRNDAGFVALIAGIANSTGRYEDGLEIVRAAISHAEVNNAPIAADLYLQLGWLLLNSHGDERDIYSMLRKARLLPNLSKEQHRGLDDIWVNWILRRAAETAHGGDPNKSLAILETSIRLLPNEPRLREALAGTLMRIGDSRRAVAVYQTWGMTGATVSDYYGAIGAAMTEHNAQLMTMWLQESLRRWPGDSHLLTLAGKVAAGKKDYKKAEAYWQAALAAMASETPTYPAPAAAQGMPRASETSGDPIESLGRMLAPGREEPSLRAPGQALKIDHPVVRETPVVTRISDSPGSADNHRTAGAGSGAGTDLISFDLALDQRTRPGADSAPRQRAYSDDVSVVPLAPMALATTQPIRSAQLSDKEEIQNQIGAINGRNTGFFDSGASVQSRTGRSGFEKLALGQMNMEGSTTLGNAVRLSLIARPTFVSSGASTGQEQLRFGLLPQSSSFEAQSAGGIAGEAQLATQNFGLRFGTTPQGFAIKNLIGGLRLRPAGGHITLLVSRDAVQDSLLSFAGATDPVTKKAWGGVIANSGALQGNWGDANSGFYLGGGFQSLMGTEVAKNRRYDGTAGAYRQVLRVPQGRLTLGMNVFGMHYEKNLRFFTLGQGGYFSPQKYMLFSIPVKWVGAYRRQLQYSVSASAGAQYLQEDASPYFPLSSVLQGRNGPYYAGQASTGANYNLDINVLYQFGPNWFAGAYLNANNARNYTSTTAGFQIKYLLKPQPMTRGLEVPSVPNWNGTQQLSVE